MRDSPAPEVIQMLKDLYALGQVDTETATAEFANLITHGYRESSHREIARRNMSRVKAAEKPL